MSTLPFLHAYLTHPSSKAFSARSSPIPGARIHSFCVFVHFCLLHILLSPSNSHLACGSDLHREGNCSLNHFPLGIASLALPAKSNRRRIISREKPNLFIFNFLPFRCQMETGQDIIIQFISSITLFFILILNSS